MSVDLFEIPRFACRSGDLQGRNSFVGDSSFRFATFTMTDVLAAIGKEVGGAAAEKRLFLVAQSVAAPPTSPITRRLCSRNVVIR